MAKRLCTVCRERPVAVPDRNRAGRPILRVCRECHAGRLTDDFRVVLKAHHAKESNGTE